MFEIYDADTRHLILATTADGAEVEARATAAGAILPLDGGTGWIEVRARDLDLLREVVAEVEAEARVLRLLDRETGDTTARRRRSEAALIAGARQKSRAQRAEVRALRRADRRSVRQALRQACA